MKVNLTKHLFFVSVVAAFLALGACGSARVSVVKAPTEALSKSVIFAKDPGSMQAPGVEFFEPYMMRRLARYGYNRNQGAELKIEYKVTQFDPGSRFLRYMFGIFGAGKATTEMTVRFLKKGQPIGEVKIKSVLKAHIWFGGSTNQLYNKAATRLAQYMIRLKL